MSILLPLKTLPSVPEPLWLPAPEYPDLPANELHIWRARMNEACLTAGEEECPVTRDRAKALRTAHFRNEILERYTTGAAPGP